jgi:isopenicillin-N N-acyltransferase-like protein
VCAHADLAEPFHMPMETIATIAIDLAARRLVVHRGGPCEITSSTWQAF